MRAALRGASRAVLRRCAHALFAAIAVLPLFSGEAAAAQQAVVLQIDGAIGPAVAD